MKLNKTEKRIRKEMILQIKIILKLMEEETCEKDIERWTHKAYQTSSLLKTLNLISFNNKEILDEIICKRYINTLYP